MAERTPWIERIAAGEQIDRREAVLGPRVDREMRFGDHDDAGDAVRAEVVHDDVRDDRRPGELHGGDELLAEAIHEIQDLGIAAVILDEEVAAERSQAARRGR